MVRRAATFLLAGLGGDWREIRTLIGNLSLRGTTSISRFVLVLSMARLLALADLGAFGVVVATANVAVTAFGLNFFQFSAREMLRTGRRAWPRMIRDQAALHVATYAVGLPVLIVIFAAGILPWSVGPWLVVIVMLDHAGQELQRVLVVLSRPLTSNIVFFLRSGLWSYAAVVVMVIFPGSRHIETVWCCWTLGGISAVACGLWSIRDLRWWQAGGSIDVAWIVRGIRSALILFGGLLCLRAVFTVDRHLLQMLGGLEAVGTYTFFSGVANTLLVLTESGVLVTHYPKLIRSFQTGDIAEYKRVTRVITSGSVTLVVVLAVAIAITIQPILAWTGKGTLMTSTPVLWVLLAGAALQVCSLLVRNALYVRQRDGATLLACAIALAVAAAANVVLIPDLGALGAAMATCLAMAVLAAASVLLLLHVRRDDACSAEADRALRAMPITCSSQGDHPKRDTAG